MTALEKRGLKWAGIVTLVYILVIAFTVIPSNGLLRDPATGGFLNSPFMAGIVPIMLFFFLLPGLAYGIAAKEVKNDKEVAEKILNPLQIWRHLLY